MRIGIPAETRPGETRVAATPETVKKLAAKHQVIVQSGAGVMASVIDEAYLAASAVDKDDVMHVLGKGLQPLRDDIEVDRSRLAGKLPAEPQDS